MEDDTLWVIPDGWDTNLKIIRLGGTNSCWILNTHEMICIGDTYWGQLDFPQTTDILDVEIGQYHTCMVTMTGELSCQGMSWFGQFNDMPVETDFIELAGGY